MLCNGAYYVNLAKTACATACAADEYADPVIRQCTKCSTPMPNCTVCTNNLTCTTCNGCLILFSFIFRFYIKFYHF